VHHHRLAATDLAGSEFLEAVEYVSKVWLPARDIVKEAIEGRHQVDKSGQIIVLKKVWMGSVLPAELAQYYALVRSIWASMGNFT
jgi:hypothetical protein